MDQESLELARLEKEQQEREAALERIRPHYEAILEARRRRRAQA